MNFMKYYVTADVHGYFSELKTALTEKGYFECEEPHKLVICGDLYDRGSEASELQDFVLERLLKDEVILIKGNHEDLAEELLHNWAEGSYRQFHHHTNGTIDTFFQLTGTTIDDLYDDAEAVREAFSQDPYIHTILPSMVDYYETEHYIFTHGWIPCGITDHGHYAREYTIIDEWRDADKRNWENARWINGMEAAHAGVIEENKTIVCGHWHCSFGHSNYEGVGGEFDSDPNFEPYYDKGIIALDACTGVSKKVNCIVLEDQPLCTGI